MATTQKGKTPQDKHKLSAWTAADDIKYRKHQNQMAMKGKTPLSKKEWWVKQGRIKKD